MIKERYLELCKSEFWEIVFTNEAEYLSNELGDYTNILSIGCGPGIVEEMLQKK